jgi:hypothetical protein
VEPDFSGSLVDLARKRVVYIVDTPQNKKAIDDCWAVGAELDLCEVNRSKKSDPDDRDGNLMKILQLVDTHYYPYPGFVVHGTSASPSLVQSLAEKGISIAEVTADGFVASIAEDAPKSGLWALTEFLAKEKRG